MAMLFDDKELQDRRIQTLLSTAVNLQQLKQQKDIANQENEYRMANLAQEVQKNKISAAELRQKAPLYKAQAGAYQALAGQRGATTDLYNNLSTMEQGGLPSQQNQMVLSGISPQGPRFENLGAIPQKQKVELANRKYDPTEAKAISQAEALVGKISRLKEMVGTKAEGMASLPFALGDEGGQLFQSLNGDIKNTLLYLRSGAQINEQEYKRLANQLPKLFRKGSVDKDQLDRFNDEFSGVLNRIKFGAQAEKISSGKAGAEDLASLGFNLPAGFKLKSFKPKGDK